MTEFNESMECPSEWTCKQMDSADLAVLWTDESGGGEVDEAPDLDEFLSDPEEVLDTASLWDVPSGFDERYRDAVADAAREHGVDSEKLQTALDTRVEDRSPRECELADLWRHRGSHDQVVFRPDENGAFHEADSKWRTKGSQVPDLYCEDEDGVHIRELKDWHNIDALADNIDAQAAKRSEAFGEEADVTFVVAANEFTIEEAEGLQQHCEENGIGLEFMLK